MVPIASSKVDIIDPPRGLTIYLPFAPLFLFLYCHFFRRFLRCRLLSTCLFIPYAFWHFFFSLSIIRPFQHHLYFCHLAAYHYSQVKVGVGDSGPCSGMHFSPSPLSPSRLAPDDHPVRQTFPASSSSSSCSFPRRGSCSLIGSL